MRIDQQHWHADLRNVHPSLSWMQLSRGMNSAESTLPPAVRSLKCVTRPWLRKGMRSQTPTYVGIEKLTDYKCLIAKLAGGGHGLPSQVVVSVTVPVTTTSSWYLLDTYQQARRRQIARWQSLWVEHIQVQVASGNAAACRPPLSRELLDSVVHPSRGWRRRVCVGSSSQLCPARARCCKATRPVPARPSCSIQHDMHTVAAEPRTPSRSPNAGKVTPPRPAPARVRPGPPEAGASSWRHGKLNFAVSRPGTASD